MENNTSLTFSKIQETITIAWDNNKFGILKVFLILVILMTLLFLYLKIISHIKEKQKQKQKYGDFN
jgi:hypothetical protein